MEPIRVLFIGFRKPGERLVHAVEGQPDIDVVGVLPVETFDTLVAVEDARPDVVITQLRHGEIPGICSHILSQHPHVSVLGIESDETNGLLLQLTLRGRVLPTVSTESIADAIREVARART